MLAPLTSPGTPSEPPLPPVTGAVPLVEVVRGGVVESVHLGHVAVTGPGGRLLAAAGDPDAVVLARSALKPLQAVAALRAGLDLDPTRPGEGEALALAAASHSGEPEHTEGVLAALARAGLTEAALQNTPDLPLDPDLAAAWRAAGRAPSSLAQNCSGKHAALLAACVAAGWPTADYLQPTSPLQRLVLATVAELTAVPEDDGADGADGARSAGGGDGTGAGGAVLTVDGCGTPLPSTRLRGLAAAYGALATAAPGTPEHAVAAAVRAHPHLLGGTGRDVTDLVAGVPGLVAKDGAEGVYAAALPDGRAVALKVLDGASRPRPVVVAAALAALGATAPVLGRFAAPPVLGHGRPVGEVRPAPQLRAALATLERPAA